MKRPLVSVVTPVHNDVVYLTECVRSVLNQTYSNWEYTIVDNASTDGTSELAARLASTDSRIRHVRFDEFVGTNENFNRAFREIEPASDFCKVVCADDWLFPECLERMVESALKSATIGMVTSYRLSDRGVDLVGLPYWQTFQEGSESVRGILVNGPVILGSTTAILFRSDLVRQRHAFFDEQLWCADNEAALWVLSQSDLGFVHQVLTFQRRAKGRVFDWAINMAVFYAEFIYFHLRYGRDILDQQEYRLTLRQKLLRYIMWHLRQFPRLSRLRTPEFFVWHRHATELILTEGGDDPEVRAAMYTIRALLARERLRTQPRPRDMRPPRPGEREVSEDFEYSARLEGLE